MNPCLLDITNFDTKMSLESIFKVLKLDVIFSYNSINKYQS